MGIFVYSLKEWLCFFFIYSFFGWIWESSYVSVKDKKLTNRGFLYGPYIPIYGSGALIVLMATLPFKDNWVLVYFFGLIAASTLEYVTGAVMEKIFGVRYWDYSEDFLNINGHICLKASLLWGVFSVLLLNVLHLPIEKMVLGLNANVLESVVFVLMIIFVIDSTVSVRNALDLKEMLRNIAENNEELRRMQKRLEVVGAVLDEQKADLKQRVDENLGVLSDYAQEKSRERKELSAKGKEMLACNVEMAKEYSSLKVEKLKERVRIEFKKLDDIKVSYANLKEEKALEKEVEREKMRLELAEIKDKLAIIIDTKRSKRRVYKHSLNLLKRNNAVSKYYAQELKQLKEEGKE